MDISIEHKSANTIARLGFKQGESWTTEAGAMIAMSPGLQLKTSTYQRNGRGGLIQGIKRMFGGESFFMNHYTADQDSTLWIAPEMQGDIIKQSLDGERLIVQSGSFLACNSVINIETGWQGFKNILSGESLFWLNLSGTGDVLLSSFGEIYEVPVAGSYIVDTGHIVAFDETLNFTLSKAGSSWFHSVMGGEGIVCRFEGTGRVWCQSHNQVSFGQSLTPHLKPKSS